MISEEENWGFLWTILLLFWVENESWQKECNILKRGGSLKLLGKGRFSNFPIEMFHGVFNGAFLYILFPLTCPLPLQAIGILGHPPVIGVGHDDEPGMGGLK
jgi:hypothetical protein